MVALLVACSADDFVFALVVYFEADFVWMVTVGGEGLLAFGAVVVVGG